MATGVRSRPSVTMNSGASAMTGIACRIVASLSIPSRSGGTRRASRAPVTAASTPMTKPARLARAVDDNARMIVACCGSSTILPTMSLSGGNVVPSHARRPATSHRAR